MCDASDFSSLFGGATAGAEDAFASGVGGLGSDAAGNLASAATSGATDALANGIGGLGSDVLNNLGDLTNVAPGDLTNITDTSVSGAATGTSSSPNLLGLNTPSVPAAGGGGALASASAADPNALTPADQTAATGAGLTPNATSTTPGGTGTPIGNATASTPSSTGGGAMDWLGKNWKMALPLALGGGSILKNMFTSIPGVSGLNSISASEQKAGQGLINTVNSGKLPPNYEAEVQNWLDNTVNNIASNYASRGMPGTLTKNADGTYSVVGNTMMAQDIQQAQGNALALRAQIGTQLSQLGLQELGGSASALGASAQLQVQQDSELSSALAELGLAAGIGSSIKS